MKLKKTPSPYVFVNKNGVRWRAIILFVSAGTYDHEDVFTNLVHHYRCSNIFLRRTKSSEVSRKIVTFGLILNNYCFKSDLGEYETEKVPFAYVCAYKTVSDIVRPCCLFLQVPMVMKKCLQTYYDIAIALENFLWSLKSSVVIHKIVTFYIILNHFGSKSGLKGYETQKKHHLLTFL